MEATPLHLDALIAQGAYGDVFHLPAADRVYKLFRRKPLDPEGRAVEAIFKAEMKAYEIAAGISSLAPHIPGFFGPVTVAEVLDTTQAVVSDRYHLNQCYALEFLPGEVRKWCATPDCYHTRLEALLDQFCEAGIEYVGDADVWNWENPSQTKLLDIATDDAAAAHAWLLFDKAGSLVQ